MKQKHYSMLVTIALTVLLVVATVPSFADSTKGSFTNMPAYYDGELFTISFFELPPAGEKTVLARNKSINIIYQSDQAEAAGVEFISVLDAIPGDGFNPLWQEVQIVFVNTANIQQLTSDTDILAAAASGEILLIPTTEVYICSVVGSKK
jgi:hypothetical protein